MKNKVSRQLYDYWNEQRGERRFPTRGQIVPGDIPAILGDTFMLTRAAPAEPAFRLAGTRICEMLGRELKGTAFISLWDARSHRLLRDILDLLSVEDAGAVAAVTGETDDESPIDLEMVLLPLGGGVAMEFRTIGTLAPMTGQVRPVLQSVSGLSLKGWRALGPQIDEIAVPRFPDEMPEMPEIAPRPHLVVLPGGRA
jgi:hypothetical protein